MLPDNRILIVDDSKVIRMTLLKVLQKLGIRPDRVQEAEDGAKALETFRTFGPHIVFLERLMPGLGGEQDGRGDARRGPRSQGDLSDRGRARRRTGPAHDLGGRLRLIEKPIRIDEVRRVLEVAAREEVGYGRIK